MEKKRKKPDTGATITRGAKQVVRLHKQGIKVMQIVQMTGLNYPTVSAALDLLEAG